MTGVIGLEQSYYKACHGAVLRNNSVGNRFRRSKQIFERVAAVGFAINKATLIQTPTLVDLGNGQRAKIVTRIDGRDQRNAGLSLWRLTAIKPPPRTKFLENC